MPVHQKGKLEAGLCQLARDGGGNDRPFVSHLPCLLHRHGLQGLRQQTVGSLGLLLVETEVELGFKGCICSVWVKQSSSRPVMLHWMLVCSQRLLVSVPCLHKRSPPPKSNLHHHLQDLTLLKDSAVSGWR